jgi:hypothetical protein
LLLTIRDEDGQELDSTPVCSEHQEAVGLWLAMRVEAAETRDSDD